MEEREGEKGKEVLGDISLALCCPAGGGMQKLGEWHVDVGVGETRAGMLNLGELDRRLAEGEKFPKKPPSTAGERNLLDKGDRARCAPCQCLTLVTVSHHLALSVMPLTRETSLWLDRGQGTHVAKLLATKARSMMRSASGMADLCSHRRDDDESDSVSSLSLGAELIEPMVGGTGLVPASPGPTA